MIIRLDILPLARWFSALLRDIGLQLSELLHKESVLSLLRDHKQMPVETISLSEGCYIASLGEYAQQFQQSL